MKSTSVVIGLLTGCIIAAACGYFSKSGIDSAPAVSFIWVQTFKLQIYPPIVLPIIAVFIICACEAIGDITATCDVSHLEVEGGTYESRIQGGGEYILALPEEGPKCSSPNGSVLTPTGVGEQSWPMVSTAFCRSPSTTE